MVAVAGVTAIPAPGDAARVAIAERVGSRHRCCQAGVVVLAGCLRNATAAGVAARRLAGTDGIAAVLAAGERWRGGMGPMRVAVEDLLGAGAGAVAEAAGGVPDAEAEVAITAFTGCRSRLDTIIATCTSGRQLVERGNALDLPSPPPSMRPTSCRCWSTAPSSHGLSPLAHVRDKYLSGTKRGHKRTAGSLSTRTRGPVKAVSSYGRQHGLRTPAALVLANACGSDHSPPRHVHGGVRRRQRRRGPLADHGRRLRGCGRGDPSEVPEIYRTVSPSVVTVFAGQGFGSGVIWSADGLIVTNNHVAGDASEVDVAFADGSRSPGTVVGVDPDVDLAVMRTERHHLPAAEVRAVEAEIASIRREVSELRRRIAEHDDDPGDLVDRVSAITLAEEQEAFLAALEARRAELLRAL